MANGVFNVAKGRLMELHDRVDGNDPAASELVVMLLKAVEADTLLRDRTDFGNILAQAANTEADFTDGVTPYARKALADTDITASVADQSNDFRWADLADQTWVDAGGTTDNNLVKLIVGYDPLGTDVDANIIPLTYHDFVFSTNGLDLTAVFNATDGYSRAA